jgi:hypothetical protein
VGVVRHLRRSRVYAITFHLTVPVHRGQKGVP